MKKTVSILLCLSLLVSLCSCAGSEEYETIEFTSMNTVMQITVFASSDTDSEDVFEAMKECIEEMDSLLDVNNSDSDISRINAAQSGACVEVDAETARLLQCAAEAYEYTDGLFDVRLLPVISLWGFDNGKYGVPDEEDVRLALDKAGSGSYYADVDGNTVTKSGDVGLTVGGIAKGYLGDRLLQIAREMNVSALLSLGGNIVLCGEKPDGTPWNVGVKNPLDTEAVVCSFESKGNVSVVTSGAYERCFEYGGEEYHHIIDPSTGYPADSELLSVTVIGEEGTVCDALSTALFVAGKEKAIEFTKEFNDCQFIFITENKEILYTEGIDNIKLSDSDFTLIEIQR